MISNIFLCQGSAKSIRQQKLTQPVSFAVSEIKNPLCNIYLAADMLALTDLDAEQQLCLGVITRGSARINNMVSNILNFPPPAEAVHEPYSLRQLLEEVLATLRERILVKRLNISADYSAMDNKIWLDARETKIALTDVLVGMIDATPSKASDLKLFARWAGETIVIEIQVNSPENSI